MHSNGRMLRAMTAWRERDGDPAWDARAREAGISVLVGCGIAPGLTGLLARLGCERLEVAERILGLRVELDRLTSLLPICAYCKNIQDDRSQWISVEQYVTTNTDTDLTHTICPSCYESEVKPELEELKRTSEGRSR